MSYVTLLVRRQIIFLCASTGGPIQLYLTRLYDGIKIINDFIIPDGQIQVDATTQLLVLFLFKNYGVYTLYHLRHINIVIDSSLFIVLFFWSVAAYIKTCVVMTSATMDDLGRYHGCCINNKHN